MSVYTCVHITCIFKFIFSSVLLYINSSDSFSAFHSKVILRMTELNEVLILTEFQIAKILSVPQGN